MTIEKVVELAERCRNLETEISAAEDALKEKKKERDRIATVDLPEAMDDMDLETFALKDGTSVSVREEMFASLPKKRMDEIEEYLRSIGAQDLVRHEVGLTFGPGEDDVADGVLSILRERYSEHGPFDRVNVNTASVKALVREMLERGEDVPLELLGVHLQRRAVLTSGGR